MKEWFFTMIEEIIMVVENPAFRILFGIVAAIFVFEIIAHVGLSSFDAYLIFCMISRRELVLKLSGM